MPSLVSDDGKLPAILGAPPCSMRCSDQEDVIPLARDLGVGIVAWGPMGTGFLTGQFTSWDDLKDGDFRKVGHKRMVKESFDRVRPSDAGDASLQS